MMETRIKYLCLGLHDTPSMVHDWIYLIARQYSFLIEVTGAIWAHRVSGIKDQACPSYELRAMCIAMGLAEAAGGSQVPYIVQIHGQRNLALLVVTPYWYQRRLCKSGWSWKTICKQCQPASRIVTCGHSSGTITLLHLPRIGRSAVIISCKPWTWFCASSRWLEALARSKQMPLWFQTFKQRLTHKASRTNMSISWPSTRMSHIHIDHCSLIRTHQQSTKAQLQINADSCQPAPLS